MKNSNHDGLSIYTVPICWNLSLDICISGRKERYDGKKMRNVMKDRYGFAMIGLSIIWCDQVHKLSLIEKFSKRDFVYYLPQRIDQRRSSHIFYTLHEPMIIAREVSYCQEAPGVELFVRIKRVVRDFEKQMGGANKAIEQKEGKSGNDFIFDEQSPYNDEKVAKFITARKL